MQFHLDVLNRHLKHQLVAQLGHVRAQYLKSLATGKMIVALSVVSFMTCGVLTGCGQRGALYLPQHTAPQILKAPETDNSAAK